MASALNKRQQARNERSLQDLIKSVPGNDRCADCGARNPGWASWSLGIFLCMRCATLHRKLGTHISKVKSLSMDSWNNEQVDNMKKIGNANSNRSFNPKNTKPSIPIDVDEVDGAMERFIRQKYEHRAFSVDTGLGPRQNTGSNSSMEDRPPPLPPKPGKRFGFGLRASSSTFPMSKPDPISPPASPGMRSYAQDSPPRVNKASRVFGHSVRGKADDSFETKLDTLREMGFQDVQRNVTVLKGLNGNLDRAVETLIKLGEGGKSDRIPSRAQTPASSTSDNVNGITINRTRPTAGPAGQSTNPFDALDSQQPVPQQSLPPLQTQLTAGNGMAYGQNGSQANSYNPFMQQPQATYSAHPGLEQSFQNLQMSQPPPQQQLFPHHTGGYGSQSAQQTLNPFYQSMTPPPMPQIPPQYQSLVQQPSATGQPLSAQPTGAGNPFLRTSRSQTFTPSNPFGGQSATPPFDQTGQPYQFSQPQTQPQQTQLQSVPEQQSFGMSSTPTFEQMQQNYQQQQHQSPNPYQQQGQSSMQYQQNQVANPYQQQQPQQQQQQQQGQMQGQMQNPYQQQGQGQVQNPYQQQQQPQQQQQGQMQNPYQQQPQYYQPTRQDKSSILALYGQPWNSPFPQQDPTAADANAPRRSVTMPVSPQVSQPASHNPFGQAMPQPLNGAAPGGARHVSNESVDFAGMMGGRHSPDAFAGLSAKWAR